MKSNSCLFLTVLMLISAGCSGSGKQEGKKTAGKGSEACAAKSGKSFLTGVVVSTLNAAKYTYVEVKTDKETAWAATNKFSVAVGDTVRVPTDMPMKGFHSKTLNRTFDLIYFTSGIEKKVAQGSGDACCPKSAPADKK